MKSGRKTFDVLIVIALFWIVNNYTVDKTFVNGVVLEKRAFVSSQMKLLPNGDSSVI